MKVGKDKVLHFWTGVIIVLGCLLLSCPLWIGALTAGIMAVSKEVVDYFGFGTCDPADVLWTLLGVVFVVVVVYLFERPRRD